MGTSAQGVIGHGVFVGNREGLATIRRNFGRSATHERLDPGRGAPVGGALQELGYEPGSWVLGFSRQDLGPIHPSGFQFFGPRIMPLRGLPHPVEIRGEPLIDLVVIEPGPNLRMDLGRPRLKEEHMPPVLEGVHVPVQGLPVIGDDCDPALGVTPRNGQNCTLSRDDVSEPAS
jgi:hypothetical protein